MTGLLAGLGAMCSLLCGLLAVFLWSSKGRLARANGYLAGFLILTAIDLLGLVALTAPGTIQLWFVYRTPLGFLQMPLFYAYVVTLCFPARAFWPHWAGGLALVGLGLIAILLSGTYSFPIWAEALMHAQFYVYLALSAWALLQFQIGLHQNRSNFQTAQVRWLWAVIGSSFVAHGLVMVRTVSAWLDGPLPIFGLQLGITFLALGILCAMTLTALMRSDLFQALDEPVLSKPVSEPALSDLEGLATQLSGYMAQSQVYLEPNLTLKQLARRLGRGERDVSRVLNQHFGQHFFDFINQARIAHAQTLIKADKARSQTLLDIAYASGFNSKSSFNSAFKKHAGLTPSAYRNAL